MKNPDYKKDAIEWLQDEAKSAQRNMVTYAKEGNQSMIDYCSKKLGMVIAMQALISVGGQ
jgi:hypothetical protein